MTAIATSQYRNARRSCGYLTGQSRLLGSAIRILKEEALPIGASVFGRYDLVSHRSGADLSH